MDTIPMTWPNGDRVRERMISDLIANERAMKEAAQQVVKDFRAVLFSIAQHTANEKVRELLRQDPGMFKAWAPVQWQTFFDQVLRECPWGSSGSTNEEAGRRWQAENRKLQEMVNFWRQKAEQLEKELVESREKVLHLESVSGRQVLHGKPAAKPFAPVATVDEDRLSRIPGVHGQIYADLRTWSPPKRPIRFQEQVSKELTQWRRQSMALYILARYGLSPRVELEHLIGNAEGLKSRPGSLRTALDLLIDKGLITSEVLRMERDTFKSALALVRLSPEGQALCQVLGWPALEGERDRLNRTFTGPGLQERIFGVLSFAMHARLRGGQVVVLPEMPGGLRSDLAIEMNGQRLYVEVNLSDLTPPDRWRDLVTLKSQIAFCAGTRLQRLQLMDGCKQRKLRVLAADLETLVPIRMSEITPESTLWSEHWEAG